MINYQNLEEDSSQNEAVTMNVGTYTAPALS